MAYVKMNVYPDGDKIPSSLPDSYMPAAYGAPARQNCFTCGYFTLSTNKPLCTKWDAPVKPRWWCKAWTAWATLWAPKV
jgi:hypothetical protein